MAEDRPEHQIDRHFVFGLVLILIGVMLALDRGWVLGSVSFWPFILLLIAAVKLIDPPLSPPGIRSRRAGAWLLLLGAWGVVNEFHVLGFDYDSSWPLLIIGIGLMMVWRAFEPRAACRVNAR
jgi:LiaF transmembrane domain